MSKEKKLPYSYHTFLFPFLWNDSGKVKFSDFDKCLDKNYWQSEKELMEKTEFAQMYNQFHYFNPAAQNAIYGGSGKNPVVRNYRYNIAAHQEQCEGKDWLNSSKHDDNPVEYVIEKGERKAELKVNGIRLKLFNTGIGILIFELENYALADEKSIIWINDFGRRIYAPYTSDHGCNICADKIALVYGDKELSVGDLTKLSGDFKETHIIEPILYLLKNGEYAVTTNLHHKNTEFFIEPIIDDRMFVACFYCNKDFVDSMSEIKEGQYSYIYDAENKFPYEKDNNARRLYEMIFIDGDGMSCHSRTMLRQLLDKHIYKRWLEYGWEKTDGNVVKSGTITGITEYSMVCVASCNFDFLVVPFLTQYVEMVILALAQRASLLAFERMISDSALGKNKIKKIQESFVLFQSQLLLKEVTPQQQGIELYDMLIRNMFIPEQTADIEKQIAALFAQKNFRNENRENLILFFVALLGIFDAINYMVSWFFNLSCNIIQFVVSIIVIISAVVLYIVNKYK